MCFLNFELMVCMVQLHFMWHTRLQISPVGMELRAVGDTTSVTRANRNFLTVRSTGRSE